MNKRKLSKIYKGQKGVKSDDRNTKHRRKGYLMIFLANIDLEKICDYRIQKIEYFISAIMLEHPISQLITYQPKTFKK